MEERAKEKKTDHEGSMEEKIFNLITNVFVGGAEDVKSDGRDNITSLGH